MKLITVIGARPQFIKAAAVSRVIRETPGVTEMLVHTGQHYDANMSQVFFDELDIPAPAHHLGIGSGAHGEQTGRMLGAIERVLLDEKPDWVLVYGDTNSTLAGALAAAKLHIPIAHVEAGLRSFNRAMPEEINRVLTDHVSERLFVPTQAAVDNLMREGIPKSRMHVVGDVMLDAALIHGERAARSSRLLERLGLTPGGYVLATIHRGENTDHAQRLETILHALRTVSERWPVLLPLHPRTRAVLDRTGRGDLIGGGMRVVEPLGYLDMLNAEQHAAAIATDSGGVQKEAFFYRVPCVTLRDETEWVELVELGWNRVVPPVDSASVAAAVFDAIATRGSGRDSQPYGDGTAARKIVAALESATGV